jgi:hypothetical protein
MDRRFVRRVHRFARALGVLAMLVSCSKKLVPGAADVAEPGPSAAPAQTFAPPVPTAATTVPAPTGTDVPLAVSSSASDVMGLLAAVAKYDAGVAPRSADASADKAPFRRAKMDDAELAKLIGQIPELAPLAGDVRFFSAGDIASIMQRSREDTASVSMTAQPLWWSPDPSVDVLVIAGRSKPGSFVVALHPGATEGSYRLASFFVFTGDHTPVVLAYKPGVRRELFWTSCWGCPGDQGGVSFREDRRVVIVQH